MVLRFLNSTAAKIDAIAYNAYHIYCKLYYICYMGSYLPKSEYPVLIIFDSFYTNNDTSVFYIFYSIIYFTAFNIKQSNPKIPPVPWAFSFLPTSSIFRRIFPFSGS